VSYYSSSKCTRGSPGSACQCFNCTRNGNASTDCDAKVDSSVTARTITRYNCVSWVDNKFPFGSEFSWDSTGQEEEFVFGRFFDTPKSNALANLTLAAILAYCPSAATWAHNGGCWSWGDTGNNAKWVQSKERVTGHYRTTLNAIPIQRQWLLDPDDIYLLPIFIGSASLHMAMIDSDGAAAMGHHLDPTIQVRCFVLCVLSGCLCLLNGC